MNLLKWFLQSRKAQLAFVAWLVAGWLTIQGQATIEQFIDSTVLLAGLLIAGIAAEDSASKLRAG